ncbi:MAG: hypothetical protein ACOCRZ_06615 [Halothermotrichaceae bacterium]
MTDQIYYKVQYPIKKAINLIKRVDLDDPFTGRDVSQLGQSEIEELNEFLNMWDNEGKDDLKDVINKLRKKQ